MEVKIRKIEIEDTANIVKWRNSENVLQYFIDQRKINEESHINWLNNYVFTGKVAQFIIVCDNQDVGSIFLRDIDLESKSAEYGVFIGEDAYRGKGVGSKASRLILEYGFNELKLDKIILRVKNHNLPAIRSYEKIGFKRIDEINEVLFMQIKKEEL